MAFTIPRFHHYMELYKIFIRILKDLNCYQEYKGNFTILPRYNFANKFYCNCNSFKEFVIALIDYRKSYENQFRYFINDSFDWNQTSQGFDYWLDINRKFIDIFELSVYGQRTTTYLDPYKNPYKNEIPNVDEGVIDMVKKYINR